MLHVFADKCCWQWISYILFNQKLATAGDTGSLSVSFWLQCAWLQINLKLNYFEIIHCQHRVHQEAEFLKKLFPGAEARRIKYRHIPSIFYNLKCIIHAGAGPRGHGTFSDMRDNIHYKRSNPHKNEVGLNTGGCCMTLTLMLSLAQAEKINTNGEGQWDWGTREADKWRRECSWRPKTLTYGKEKMKYLDHKHAMWTSALCVFSIV